MKSATFSPYYKDKYKYYRNLVSKVLQQSKKLYFETKTKEASAKQKWEIINSLAKRLA